MYWFTEQFRWKFMPCILVLHWSLESSMGIGVGCLLRGSVWFERKWKKRRKIRENIFYCLVWGKIYKKRKYFLTNKVLRKKYFFFSFSFLLSFVFSLFFLSSSFFQAKHSLRVGCLLRPRKKLRVLCGCLFCYLARS